jgi:hypothetical protein
MPRKSAAELETVSHIQDRRPRITVPDGLSREELTLFRKIVEDCHPLHFAQSDAPLLRAYVQACILGEMAFEAAQESPDALGDWERCCKTMAALSVKLRSLREFGGVSLETLAALRDGARGWATKG